MVLCWHAGRHTGPLEFVWLCYLLCFCFVYEISNGRFDWVIRIVRCLVIISLLSWTLERRELLATIVNLHQNILYCCALILVYWYLCNCRNKRNKKICICAYYFFGRSFFFIFHFCLSLQVFWFFYFFLKPLQVFKIMYRFFDFLNFFKNLYRFFDFSNFFKTFTGFFIFQNFF